MTRVTLRFVGKEEPRINLRGLYFEKGMSLPQVDIYSLNVYSRLCIRFDDSKKIKETVLVSDDKKSLGNLYNRVYRRRFSDWVVNRPRLNFGRK